MFTWHPTSSRLDEHPFGGHRCPPSHLDIPIRSRIQRLGIVASTVFTLTYYSGTIAHARRVGEGTAVFAGALRLIEGRKVVGEVGGGLFEDGVKYPIPWPTVIRGPEAIKADFPC